VSRGNFKLRLNDARQTAAVDYITDPERRPAAYHHSRIDREYSSACALDTFQSWATEDKWVDRRAKFWEEIEARVMKEYGDQLFKKKMLEVGELTLAQDSILEYLLPRTNPDGSVARYPTIDPDTGKPHEYAGLPVLPLDLPSMDKVAKMLVEVAKVIMVKRGETTSRTEQVTVEATGETRRVTALDPVGGKVSFSREDIRAMSRLLLMRRQPELEADTIDVPEEEGIPEDEW
jgi:hypothetical protein